MLAISSAAGLGPGISGWVQAGPAGGAAPARGAGPSGPSHLDTIDIPLSRQELLAMVAGSDESTRIGNALSTAHEALGVIGGLLGNVRAVLSAASSHDPSFDIQTDQSRIDSAVSTIDAVASGTKFGGQKLLDGTFDAAGVTVPPFSSGQLGSDASAEAEPLATLVSGASNDLASGHVSAAGRIVTTALSQVTTTQDRIAQRQNPPSAQPPELPPGLSTAQLMITAASQILADPALAAAAVANSSPGNVFALLRG